MKDQTKRIAWLGAGEWEFYSGSACGGECETQFHLRDPMYAGVWLRQLKSDAFKVEELRQLLAGDSLSLLYRMTDDEILERVANLIGGGFLHVHIRVVEVREDGGSAVQAAVEQAPVPIRREAARPVVIPESDSLASDADHAAIAGVLKAAAASGVPFCEECAKAAQQRA